MRPFHLLVLPLLAFRVAGACQCGDRPGPLEALPQSTAVFDGTVVRRTPFLATVYGFHVVLERNEFIVHHAWRGPNVDHIDLLTGFGNCDFLFDVGSRYVVFARLAHPPTTGLASSICLPTESFRRSGPTLVLLGPGLPFRPPGALPAESSFTRLNRIARSSSLWGVLSIAGDSRFPFAVRFRPRFLVAPLLTLVLLGAVAVLTLRRRFRLLAFLSPLLLLAIAFSLALQGYALIRSDPMLSYWILERVHGA